MAVNTVDNLQEATAITARGPSPAIWGRFPVNSVKENPGLGTYNFNDFLSGGLITSPTTEAALVGESLSGFGSDAGGATAGIARGNAVYTTAVNDAGVITLKNTTTAHATSIRSAVTPYRVSAGFGYLAWECRVKLSTVATLEISFFFGLMEDTAALTVNVPLLAGSTHALSDNNLVGFFKPVANTTTFNGSYKANGVTAVDTNSGIGVLVADTYVKLGFTFNQRGDNLFRWYINNVEQASTKTVPDNTGTDFPADVALGTVLAFGCGSAASDNIVTIDWIAEGQMFANAF